MPAVVPLSISAVFAALRARLRPNVAYDPGFILCWLGWCFAFPAWVLGEQRAREVLRRGRRPAGPESCVDDPRGRGEALTGARGIQRRADLADRPGRGVAAVAPGLPHVLQAATLRVSQPSSAPQPRRCPIRTAAFASGLLSPREQVGTAL